MPALLLDALTLAIVISYVLSALVALLPEPRSEAAALSRGSLFRLYLPPGGSLVVLALGFWPALREALGGAPDHCLETAAHQPHLCWIHGVGGAGSSHDVAVLLVLLACAGVVLWQAFQWAQALGRLELLKMVTDGKREAELRRLLEGTAMAWPGEIKVVAIGYPFCFVMGVRHPRLVLSTAVLDGLSATQLAAVVAHERAHLDRRDNAWRVIAQLASLAHLPGLGRRAYARWAFAAEVACDQIAAATLGSRYTVADALVRFQRLLNDRGGTEQGLSRLGATFLQAGALDRRVRLLVEKPRPRPSTFRYWPWILLPIALWQADRIHHALEAFLELLHG